MICNKKAQNNNEIEKMLSNQISNKKGKTLTLEEDQFIRPPSPPPKQRTFVKNVNVMSITEFNNISYTLNYLMINVNITLTVYRPVLWLRDDPVLRDSNKMNSAFLLE